MDNKCTIRWNRSSKCGSSEIRQYAVQTCKDIYPNLYAVWTDEFVVEAKSDVTHYDCEISDTAEKKWVRVSAENRAVRGIPTTISLTLGM